MMEIEDTPSASCDLICQAIINCDELGLNKQLAAQVFTLWATSPLLGKSASPNISPFPANRAFQNSNLNPPTNRMRLGKVGGLLWPNTAMLPITGS